MPENEAEAQVGGSVSDNLPDSGKPVKIGGRHNTTLPTYSDGDRCDAQFDVNGRLIIGADVADNAADAGNPVKVGGVYNATAPSYASGDRADLQVSSRGLFRGEWRPSNQADEATNDSDKTLTVPAATEWKIQSIRVELVTTATGGDRQMAIQVRDAADDVIFEVVAGSTQIANLTYHYHFAPHLADLTAIRDTEFIMSPFPELILPTGFDLRIFDNNAVDAAADDMVIQMLVMAREDLG